MIKMIVCDLDGTLLNNFQHITKKTADVVRLCEKEGIEFMFATGRCFDMVEEYLTKNDFHLDLILNNGAQYISKDKKDVRVFPMSHEKVRESVAILLEHKFHISMHTTKGKYIFEDLDDYYASHFERVTAMFGKDNLEELMKEAFFRKDGFLKNTHVISSLDEMFNDGAEVLKIDADCEYEDEGVLANQKLKEVEHILLSTSYAKYIEVCSDQTHKGALLKTICDEKGYKNDEVAVFGDSTNDIQMLELFENSYVPVNGRDEAKECAKYIIGSNHEDGVADAILEIIHNQKS